MSRPWPTEAAACWVARSFGRFFRPSGAMPVAIAPEETRRTWWPLWVRAQMASVSAAMRASSIAPLFVVSDEEPTLTTVRGDPAISGRAGPTPLSLSPLSFLPPWPPSSCSTASSFQTPVRATRAGCVTATRREFRVPVEDDRVVEVADQHRVAGLGARLGEGPLDAQPGQSVREVANRLVVGEVGLVDPAQRLLAADQVRAVVRADDLEAGVLDRRRADHHADRLRFRRHRAGLLDDLGHGELQLAQALRGSGGDLVDGEAACFKLRLNQVGEVAGLGDVHLVEHDDPRAVGEAGACQAGAYQFLVGGEFGLDRVQVGDRVTAGLVRRAVKDMHERRAALDVAQEVEAEALALARTGNQAGHVGDDVLNVARLGDAEVRYEGRERVVGDLRPCRRHGGDQGGLACVRKTDEADVRDCLKLKRELALLPRLAPQ